ncbi:hypothetical protein GGS21DRAFT_506487 [Xylaria nigripes]|nr:hypothetical protein GGS21DRAFT_506487 [Xylaria nigripes]
MNTRPPIELPSEQAALSIAFNNDSSRFAVGIDSGFVVFLANTCQIQTARGKFCRKYTTRLFTYIPLQT